jgi:hypothetical protein
MIKNMVFLSKKSKKPQVFIKKFISAIISNQPSKEYPRENFRMTLYDMRELFEWRQAFQRVINRNDGGACVNMRLWRHPARRDSSSVKDMILT